VSPYGKLAHSEVSVGRDDTKAAAFTPERFSKWLAVAPRIPFDRHEAYMLGNGIWPTTSAFVAASNILDEPPGDGVCWLEPNCHEVRLNLVLLKLDLGHRSFLGMKRYRYRLYIEQRSRDPFVREVGEFKSMGAADDWIIETVMNLQAAVSR